MEIPKKLTAINDVTGALIKSKGDNRDSYASGWDAIWGKKEQKRQDPPNDNCDKVEEYAQGGVVPNRASMIIGQNNLEEEDYAGIKQPQIDLNTQVDTNPQGDDENASKDVLRGHNEH